MKKLITGIAIMMAMTLGAQAQDPAKHKDQKYGHHQEELYKELNLTDAQKQQVTTLNADFRTKMEGLKKDEGITVKEMKDKRKALFIEHRTAVQNLLTSEQKTKFDELVKKNGKEKHHKGDGGANAEQVK